MASALDRRPARRRQPRLLLENLESRVLLTVTNVPVGANLQTYLNNAVAGDTLVLPAGATYTGNFTLPYKSGSATITLQSSALASLPAGVRVGPAQAGLMPKIVTAVNDVPAMVTEAANASHGPAHDYTFLGIEFGPATQPVTIGELISLGTSGAAQNTLAEVPSHFTFDRCYIHGSLNNVSQKRGIGLNSGDTTIKNSYVSEIHSTGQDAQAIGGYNGPGPFVIDNNYLEASGENVLFGGADATIPNLVPSNITVTRNLMAKPLSWLPADPSYAGVDYSIKNIFELKNAANVTVDRNIFENNWVDSQVGFAIVFTPRNQDGGNPWATVANVNFTNNIVRHSAQGVNILSSDDGNTSLTAHDINIKNNLFYDIGGSKWGGGGNVFQFIKGKVATTNITVEHNTVQSSNINTFISADSGQNGNVPIVSSGWVFRNNIVDHGTYGAHGTGTGVGTSALTPFFPGYVFVKNVIIGGNANSYPPNNFFPANDAAVGWVNLAQQNYNLVPGSTYTGQATDGTDVGVNYPRVISINRTNANPTNAASVNFTVTFDVPVAGVDSGDFALVKSGITGGSITTVTGSGTTWNVLVNAGTGNGTLGLNLVDNDSILNGTNAPLAGLNVLGNFTGQVYTLDRTAPIVNLLSPTAGLMINGTTATISGTAGRVSGDSTSVTVKIYAGTTATGNPVQTLTTPVNPSTGAFSVNSTGLPQGRYTVQVSQSDNAGNTGASAAVTYYTYNTLPGDANNDGTVNFADFTVLSNHYGVPTNLGPTNGDFNYDGTVDFADFTILSNHYGMTSAANFLAAADLSATSATTTTTAAQTTKKNKHAQQVTGADVLDERKRHK